MNDKIYKHSDDHESGGEKEHKECEHHEQPDSTQTHFKTAPGFFDLNAQQTVSSKFENPLAGIPKDKLFEDVSMMHHSNQYLQAN